MDRRGRVRALGLWLATGVLVVACGDPPSTPGLEPAAPAAPVTAQPSDAASPWRFVPTLEQNLPEGAVAETVLELSQPRERSVVILAAVLRAGAERVQIERWTFAQSSDGQSLDLVAGGEPVLRLRSGTRHPELPALRRDVAAPGVVVTRPLGLPVAEPRALIDQLSAEFAIMRDAKAEPRARVRAAAAVVRGLDDALVLELDAIWQIDLLLDPAPTSTTVEQLAERRARVELPAQAGTATLELQRKSEGWAISSLTLPKAPMVPDPSPTAPP